MSLFLISEERNSVQKVCVILLLYRKIGTGLAYRYIVQLYKVAATVIFVFMCTLSLVAQPDADHW